MAKKQENISLQIVDVEVTSSEFSKPENIEITENFTFNFDLFIEQKFSIKDKFVAVCCNVEIYSKKHKNFTFAKMTNICYFDFPEIDKYINDSNEIVLPEPFTMMLNSISISTTRGVMASTYKGTFLQRAVLPLFDPSSIKKK